MINVVFFTEVDKSWQAGEIIKTYPHGFKEVFDSFLNRENGYNIKYAYQTEDSCSLTKELVDFADVMIWWGHLHHNLVPNEIVDFVCNRVKCGMGIVFLHSSHISKAFTKLMGTSGRLNCFENEKIRERIWTIMPSHAIAQGIDEQFELGLEEMYGEPFGIPTPDELVFLGWFNTGNVFRTGVCYYRDKGKIFYFQPGHETFPTYYNKNIQTIIKNAINWANPLKIEKCECSWTPPLEKI